MSAEFIMSLAKEIDRLRDVLAEIRLLTNNPDDNGLAVVKVYHAATVGLNGVVGDKQERGVSHTPADGGKP